MHRSARPGGAIPRQEVPARIRAAKERERKAGVEGGPGRAAWDEWYRVTSDSTWGTVLGVADVPLVEDYCLCYGRYERLNEAIEEAVAGGGGEVWGMKLESAMTQARSLGGRLDKHRIEFSRRTAQLQKPGSEGATADGGEGLGDWEGGRVS